MSAAGALHEPRQHLGGGAGGEVIIEGCRRESEAATVPVEQRGVLRGRRRPGRRDTSTSSHVIIIIVIVVVVVVAVLAVYVFRIVRRFPANDKLQ